MTSLRELQSSFAAALRDPAAQCAVSPSANLAVYRHQAESQFANVLGISFPVVRRRVGNAYFRQLAHHYRRAYPSRSGDLQWVGRDFAPFLRGHLVNGDYAWLADLAELEWLRELAAIAQAQPTADVSALACHAPDALEHLHFRLQPSLSLLDSPFPVFSVWLANQDAVAPPVDRSVGPECGMVLAHKEYVQVRRLDRALFVFIRALERGQTLGSAMTDASLDESGLMRAMREVFSGGVVCEVLQRPKR